MGSPKGIFTAEPQIQGEFLSVGSREEMSYQEREVIPSAKDQIITPEGVRGCLSKVIVRKIPQNYGKISYNGEALIVE